MLILVVSIILFGKLSQKQRLLCLLVLSLSIYNPYFISGIYPFLPAQHLKQKKILINILFLRFILENAYFLGCSILFPFYYLWGIPIIILSIVIVRWKYTANILFLLSLIVLTFQYLFNYAISKKMAYTLSSNDGIVANYDVLRDYFPKINNISVEELQKKQSGFFIFPIAENKDLIKENYIKSNNIYLLLAEHDNLNGFLNKYPYFNNDGYQIPIPWNLFKPNFVLPLKYIADKDIFYSSNIGCSVKSGYPIIWEYTWYGKPIILSSLANINKSKVFLWGDSDFFVNKLIPYNVFLVEGFLGRIFYVYYIFAAIYAVILYYLQRLNNINKPLVFVFIAVIIIYLFPLQPQTNAKISIYSEIPYRTAHNEAHVSSFLNILGRQNVAIQPRGRDANILVLKSKNDINEFPNAQIIYLLSGARLSLNGSLLRCSNIKIGKESSTNIVDARFLIINNKLRTTSLYQNSEYIIVCTGSPQLNTELIMRKIIDDK